MIVSNAGKAKPFKLRVSPKVTTPLHKLQHNKLWECELSRSDQAVGNNDQWEHHDERINSKDKAVSNFQWQNAKSSITMPRLHKGPKVRNQCKFKVNIEKTGQTESKARGFETTSSKRLSSDTSTTSNDAERLKRKV